MAEGAVLPYLDIPFQHASPEVLRAMRRPARQDRMLERIRRWRELCPELVLRSTFLVGFPGETEEDFAALLDWLEDAELDRVGCFAYEDVAGAAANRLPGRLPPAVREERRRLLMARQEEISARRLARRVGDEMRVLIDEAGEDVALGRSYADAPEIDGRVHVANPGGLRPGDLVWVRITASDAHDLYGEPVAGETS